MRFSAFAYTLPFIYRSVVGFPQLQHRASAQPYCSPDANDACDSRNCCSDDNTLYACDGWEWSIYTCNDVCINSAMLGASCCLGGDTLGDDSLNCFDNTS